jgi:hypothetical protein
VAGRTEQGSATLRTLVYLAEVEPISDSVRAFNARPGLLKMTVQEAVAFLFQQKEDPGAAFSRSSLVFGIVFSARPVELFRYRYTAGDGLPTP